MLKLLFCLILIASFPSLAISQTHEYVVNHAQGQYNVKQPTLPYNVLNNCFNWITYNYPHIVSTSQLSSDPLGTIVYMRVRAKGGGIVDHWAIKEGEKDDMIFISETNYFGHKKTSRWIPRSSVVGFYNKD